MRYPRKGVIQIAEIANGIMDPLLSKRAGINTALLGSWDEIAGDDFADCTRPEKITWPRRDEGPDRGGYQPGVLTIACEGARALFLTHAQGEPHRPHQWLFRLSGGTPDQDRAEAGIAARFPPAKAAAAAR